MKMSKGYDPETCEILEVFEALSAQGFCVAINFGQPNVDFLEMRYNLDWMTHYSTNGLLLDDPTVTFGLAVNGHVTWDDLRQMYPDRKTLFACRSFGIAAGNTLSVEIDGVKSIISSAGWNWSFDEIKKARRALHMLHLIHAKPKSEAA